MVKSCILSALLLGWMTVLPAQNRISFDFNDDSQQWSIVRGKVVLEAAGAYEGKAMKMSPDAIVRFRFASTSVFCLSDYGLDAYGKRSRRYDAPVGRIG